ncbi:MAG: nucleotide-binding protein [Bacteroidia bacterium]|nr:nucleotide-binding protein [Bacteroidia bacterium]
MKEHIDKIDLLIKTAESFTWTINSHATSHGIYGNEPSPAWNTWVGRIELLLKHTVKPNSEPFVYFNTAKEIRIEGNLQDNFELAKDGYIGALTSLKSLITDGDPFNELLDSASKTIKNSDKNSLTDKDVVTTLSNKKVFIVHGHDHSLKIELEVFLSHIGLKPIVLHREADSGQTIIEKFESNSDVAFVFILLTPDEIAYTIDQENVIEEERKKEFRARPNVIFEFGYFVAKLGRNRVCALHKGAVSIPTDLSGFIYKKVDSSIEEIGFSLIKELKTAGLTIEI